ncbi:terminase [Salmonella enterica]|uniref:Terminase n=4 Tax=Salmonella enterica TaxID=28901 RepID=A0A5X8Y018_SALNE|nr:terminase [Salmonella enterica subsp. enterica serovar Rubislaw]EAB1499789.1 terminase [Salmonella enterica]EAB6208833.1 terminase [Salmonella enterica subsp. enterica serovar Agbeni]EBF6639531.1 terminase [Salmonella enterica subsp. enterica serovar Reading]EBQ4756004.1 terminase [Salmonella enterica subsp. diarizonae]EBS2731468.1 terminase [Salmonella enterica subsp. enterica serovar Cotham]EBV0462444.1 terminase [Salmonella enterica subsp. enterica serovar Newport]EBW6386704.1 terminas
MARPTKYQAAYAEQARKLCLLGYTDAELADFFDVDEATINRWKKEHHEFCESIKKGKSVADGEVAAKLFHRATGYEHPEDDIRTVDGKIVITPTIKHYPPDTTAAIFWLKNRQKNKWRDKQDHELSGEIQVVNKPLSDLFENDST